MLPGLNRKRQTEQYLQHDNDQLLEEKTKLTKELAALERQICRCLFPSLSELCILKRNLEKIIDGDFSNNAIMLSGDPERLQYAISQILELAYLSRASCIPTLDSFKPDPAFDSFVSDEILPNLRTKEDSDNYRKFSVGYLNWLQSNNESDSDEMRLKWRQMVIEDA